jgi:hypothetical protein
MNMGHARKVLIMIATPDPFSTFESAAQIGLFIGVGWIIFLVIFRKKKARRCGFHYSASSVGFALQQLQAIARPPIEHQLKEQQKDDIKEENEGGPDDPTRYYRRLRERIDQNHSYGNKSKGD